MSYILRVLDGAGRVAGWITADDQITPVAWEAREFTSRAAADDARARMAVQFGLPDEYGLGELEVVEVPATVVAGYQVQRLGPIEPGSVLVVYRPADAVTGQKMHQKLAATVGHDEFGVIFVDPRDTRPPAELLTSSDLAERGWVFVGSPGVCPSCGSDQVVVQADRIPARRCSSCGHSWNEYCAARTAA